MALSPKEKPTKAAILHTFGVQVAQRVQVPNIWGLWYQIPLWDWFLEQEAWALGGLDFGQELQRRSRELRQRTAACEEAEKEIARFWAAPEQDSSSYVHVDLCLHEQMCIYIYVYIYIYRKEFYR